LNIEDTIDEHQLTIREMSILLQVAFNNLIDNACKYSPEHVCSIDVSECKKTVHPFFQYRNHYISEDLQHIFEPFYRSENPEKEKGYGIGLFLTEKNHSSSQCHYYRNFK
jgi:K+-sensing histidine kinase KdpD